jgi:hypothetical protein
MNLVKRMAIHERVSLGLSSKQGLHPMNLSRDDTASDTLLSGDLMAHYAQEGTFEPIEPLR